MIMQVNSPAAKPTTVFEMWTTPGSPVSVAYDFGYAEGWAAAAAEIARLRAENAAIKRQSEVQH